MARFTKASRFEYEVAVHSSTDLARLSEELDGLNLSFQSGSEAGTLLLEKRSRTGESFVELIQDKGRFLPDSEDFLKVTESVQADLRVEIVGSRRRRLRISSTAAIVLPAVVLQVLSLVPRGVRTEGWLYGSYPVLNRIETDSLVKVTEKMFGRSVLDELRGLVSESLHGLSGLLELVETAPGLGASIDLPFVQHEDLPAELYLRWKRTPGKEPILAVSSPAGIPEATERLLASLMVARAQEVPGGN